MTPGYAMTVLVVRRHREGREEHRPLALPSEKEPGFETGASNRRAFETKWAIDLWRGGNELARGTRQLSGAVRTEINFDLDGRGKCQGEDKQLVAVIKLYQALEGSSWWVKTVSHLF